MIAKAQAAAHTPDSHTGYDPLSKAFTKKKPRKRYSPLAGSYSMRYSASTTMPLSSKRSETESQENSRRESLELQAGRLATSKGHSWSWIKKANTERLLDYLENPIYPSWWELGLGRRLRSATRIDSDHLQG
jgi:hypothetical protein